MKIEITIYENDPARIAWDKGIHSSVEEAQTFHRQLGEAIEAVKSLNWKTEYNRKTVKIAPAPVVEMFQPAQEEGVTVGLPL